MRNEVYRFALIVCLCAAAVSRGGDLDPPPGPIGPTMKSLDVVEPRTPLQVPEGSAERGPMAAVLTIATPGSYFMIANINVPAGLNGIDIAASDVTLDMRGFAILGAANSLDGIVVTGIQTNISIYNGSISGCGQHGIDASDDLNTQLRDLRVYSCGGHGLRGGRGTIVRCTVADVGLDGIFGAGLISECMVSGCQYAGIRAAGPSVIRDCNVFASFGGGILAATSSTISNCAAFYIKDIQDPGRASFEVGDSCLVRGNMCADFMGPSATGIRANGSSNRIEANNVYFLGDSTIGVQIVGTGNLIMGNSVAGLGTGTRYSIAPGNSYGQIVNVAGVGAFTGLDPHTNFEY